jgi:hypothetical protein
MMKEGRDRESKIRIF